METLGRRERKKQETARAIADAALYLVWVDGLDETTIESISDRADVTSRTFFNYFASKEDAVLGIGRNRPDDPPLPRADAQRSALSQVHAYLRTLLSDPAAGDPEHTLMRRAVQARYPQLIAREYGNVIVTGDRLMSWIVAMLPSAENGHPSERQAIAILQLVGAAYRMAVDVWSTDATDAMSLAERFDEALGLLAAVVRSADLP